MKPTTLVIFGVSGDLAARKLLPALYWLLKAEALPPDFHIVGVSRREVTPAALIETMCNHLGDDAHEGTVQRLERLLQTVKMDSADPADYSALLETLEQIERGRGGERLLHLSIPPSVSGPVITAMRKAELISKEQRHTRLLLEKPFGFDLASAERLNEHLHEALLEEQVYRIDHYLAKETAQNISVFRFQNPLIAAVWSNQHIERIEIEASEAIGIEGRANFYEQTGALRDVVQSHLLSLAALVMMEEPSAPTPDALHRERRQLLSSFKPLPPDEIATRAIRGQYSGYRDEANNNESLTETFAALKLEVDSDRWRGVPVIVSGGKALDAKRTEIRVYFRQARDDQCPNRLTLRIQPAEGIQLELEAKQPGLTTATAPMQLEYTYAAGRQERQPDGYERVLLEAISGDRTNFLTGPEVLASWHLAEPVLRAWQRSDEGLKHYEAGTAANKLLEA